MAPYEAKFSKGDLAKVASADALAEFARTWKLHHPLQPDQMVFAGHVAKIAWSGSYHGGDMLYQLDGVPGIWHERLLGPP